MKTSIFFMLMLLFQSAYSQYTTGVVFEKDEKGQHIPVAAASLFLPEFQTGVYTDSAGRFSIFVKDYPTRLVVFATGYETDTVILVDAGEKNIQLFTTVLNAVEINERQKSSFTSTVDPMKTEILTEKEFHKAACCNLSESFETNASVDVAYSDAVTGKKEIQMLGLAGKYVQLLVENQPMVRGLGKSVGLDYIPGPWVQSIQITKGAGSVVNGYESMTGQINIELAKPDNNQPLFVNLYANHLGRMEGNITTSHKVGKNLNTALLLHGSGLPIKVDRNQDSFLDLPLYNNAGATNRWQYRTHTGFQGEFGVSGNRDERRGGQTFFNPELSPSQQTAYGYQTLTYQGSVYAKNGYVFQNAPHRSIGTQVSALYFQQKADIGLRRYEGYEKSAHVNLIYQDQIGTQEKHSYKAGISYVFDDFRQSLDAKAYNRTEHVPGVFAEYTYKPNERFTAVSGLRFDYHNLYGAQWTPRLHLKFNITEDLTARASGGRGWRVGNPLVDNQGAMVSSRQVHIDANLRPESSWNTGGSLNYSFKLFKREADLGVDYFFTYFTDQIMIDQDESPTLLHYGNLEGQSYSHALQIGGSFEPLNKLEVRLAYKYVDVRGTTAGKVRPMTFIPNHRVLVNIAYEIGRWSFDATMNFFGPSRLPITTASPAAFQRPDRSPAFAQFSAQITRRFPKIRLDWYVGGENLSGVRQKNPIVSANNPSGPYFDASMVWGPILGQVVYTGIRWKLRS